MCSVKVGVKDLGIKLYSILRSACLSFGYGCSSSVFVFFFVFFFSNTPAEARPPADSFFFFFFFLKRGDKPVLNYKIGRGNVLTPGTHNILVSTSFAVFCLKKNNN